MHQQCETHTQEGFVPEVEPRVHSLPLIHQHPPHTARLLCLSTSPLYHTISNVLHYPQTTLTRPDLPFIHLWEIPPSYFTEQRGATQVAILSNFQQPNWDARGTPTQLSISPPFWAQLCPPPQPWAPWCPAFSQEHCTIGCPFSLYLLHCQSLLLYRVLLLTFLKDRLYFIEQFWVHRKIKSKVQKFPI